MIVEKCRWCQSEAFRTIGHTGASFPKSCSTCGHQEGDRWEWKELTDEFNRLNIENEQLKVELEALKKSDERTHKTLDWYADKLEKAEALNG